MKQTTLGFIKALLGAVPVVGPALDESLFEIRARIQQDRINDLVKRLAAIVTGLREDSIDHAHLKSEEFSDLLVDVLARAARVSEDKQRQRFAQVIARSVLGHREAQFDRVFRELVENLSDVELRILAHFIPFHEAAADAADWHLPLSDTLDYTQERVLGHSPTVTRQIIQNLIRKGLLFDDSHGRMDSRPYTIIMPTDLGAEFYRWLQNLPEAVE